MRRSITNPPAQWQVEVFTQRDHSTWFSRDVINHNGAYLGGLPPGQRGCTMVLEPIAMGAGLPPDPVAFKLAGDPSLMLIGHHDLDGAWTVWEGNRNGTRQEMLADPQGWGAGPDGFHDDAQVASWDIGGEATMGCDCGGPDRWIICVQR